MQKKKITLIFLLLILAIIISFGSVTAHSIGLDPNSLISFPMIVSNGKGNITIKNSETGYSLYYQAVEISNTNYAQIEQITNNGKTELNSIKTAMQTLNKQCDDLEKIYDEKYEIYKGKLDSGVTETDLETSKADYETAKTNYQNKVTEYNNKSKEYNNKVDEINDKIKQLTPTYIENNWIKTENTSFNVDLSKFSGDKAFAVWAKLISSNGIVTYDEATYTMSGTKVEDVDINGISLNKTSLELTVGDSSTLIATITPSNATNKNIIWKSEDENIATVSNGKIIAKSAGKTKIIVTTEDGKFNASCELAVSNKIEKLNDTTSSNKIETSKDTTIATQKLPNTGKQKGIIAISLLAIGSISIIFYKKYLKYKGV